MVSDLYGWNTVRARKVIVATNGSSEGMPLARGGTCPFCPTSWSPARSLEQSYRRRVGQPHAQL